MPRVCIVETTKHPSPGTLGRRLAEIERFTVRVERVCPEPLDSEEILVLNSIPIPEDRILRFVAQGESHDASETTRPLHLKALRDARRWAEVHTELGRG